MANAITALLDEGKAEDIILVPLAGKSSIADFLIIASGRSGRHVSALADQIGRYIKDHHNKTARHEGKGNGDWVITDAGDVIVHIFRPEVRSFYNLEKIWVEPAETAQPAPKKRKA